MKIIDYINPSNILKRFKKYRKIISYKSKYVEIIKQLDNMGSLKRIGITKVSDYLYVGINLNENLLSILDDRIRESAELKYVSDKMKVYTNFLQGEGILDSIIADYAKIYPDLSIEGAENSSMVADIIDDNKDYYAYIVQIRYDDREFNKLDYRYSIFYLFILPAIISTAALFSIFFIL